MVINTNRIRFPFTWIFWRLEDASLRFCGTSKHLAVLILALTSHCWKSLKAERKPWSSSFSLLWHPLEAWRLRLEHKTHGIEPSLRPTIECFSHQWLATNHTVNPTSGLPNNTIKPT